MSWGNVTTALQVSATTGNGLALTLPEPRFLTLKVQGNGPVSAGQVTIECCPQNTPMIPGASSGAGILWTALNTIAVPVNATTEWFAGSVSGTFRARISTPVSNGSVTVLAIRPEEQRGWSRRPL
jgi:hypothetical protein